MKDRIAFLDGHRGLAILLVFGFHAFSRWSAAIPNGDCCGHFPVFRFGWVGVELFFLLSGFVILMTLERCERASVFFLRRWLRLFPAMLACSLIIFFSAPLFPQRPGGAPGFDSLLPGLLFSDLTWPQRLFRHPINPLEGTFWSLYVEVKFYVFAGLVYFRFGRLALLNSLVAVAALALGVKLVHELWPGPIVAQADALIKGFGLEFWFWFAGGAACYLHRSSGQTHWAWLALACVAGGSAALASVPQHFLIEDFACGIAMGGFFALSMHSERLRAMLDNRVLQFMGFVSYPLYLLHENMLIAVLMKLAPRVPRALFPLLPLALLLPLAGLAYLVARHVEHPLKARLGRWVGWLQAGAGRARTPLAATPAVLAIAPAEHRPIAGRTVE